MKKTVRELRPGDKVLLVEMPEKGIIIYNEIYNEKPAFTIVTSITEYGVVTLMDSAAIFSRSQHTVEVSTNRKYILWADPSEFFTRYWGFITKNSRTIKAWRLLGYLKKYLELEEEYEENME